MDNEIFEAKQHFVSCNQLLHFTPEMIFPLLCPKREYDWIESWKGHIIYSKSGFAELDCVFSTEFPGDLKEIWIVDRIDENEQIQFVRFTESRVIRYRITLIDNNNGTSTAIWEQTITSLNKEGNMYIENFSDTEYEKRTKTLEKMLNYYLTTGQMLKMNK
jgi:hypothetical protein